MARPKKTETETMTHTFIVRLTDTQHGIIKKYADQLGMSMASYIRHQAIHGRVDINYPIVASIPEIQKLTYELGKIGTNLNQIAKYYNTGGLQAQSVREDINTCIVEIMNTCNKINEMAGEFNGNTQTPIE